MNTSPAIPPGRLTLIRHGESVWNRQSRFTGWFDVAFTSNLLRAQDTLYESLKYSRHCDTHMRVHEHESEWYEHFTPTQENLRELKIYLSSKLNERYYGDLQGQNKYAVRRRFGAEQVHLWRRSYEVPPPNGESLKMTEEHVVSYFLDHIAPRLRLGQSVLVSAHGNSLRALVMHIERMTPGEILDLEIPTGTPYVYLLDSELRARDKQVLHPTSARDTRIHARKAG